MGIENDSDPTTKELVFTERTQDLRQQSSERHEIEAQLDAAHRHPRSVSRFLRDAETFATLNDDIAQSCIYALPRGGKTISGPSARFAEICASTWGNIHVAARIVSVDEREVVAQAGAWDLERNYRRTTEIRRGITDKHGNRYNEDMIRMTANAALSIASRNAVFQVIPQALRDQVFAKVRRVAVGDASTLATYRAKVLTRLGQLGASEDRVLAVLGKAKVDDIDATDLETLVGYGTLIKDGEKTVDELFPAPVPVTAKRGAGRPRKVQEQDAEPVQIVDVETERLP